MGNNYYDYTANYNFSKEFNERKNYSSDGETIGEVELDNGFFAELVKNGGIYGVSDRIMVWLCHREHKEKVYAFTMMMGTVVCGRDTVMQNTVRIKFATNYAGLKRAYIKKYCSTERKMDKEVSAKD